MSISSIDTVYYTCIFILPGFIIKNIIDSINPPCKYKEGIFFLNCIMYSVINCAVWSWLYNILNQNRAILLSWYWILLVIVTVIGASLIAFFLGIIKSKESIRHIFQKFGINLIHPVPTAWDYVFSRSKASWVVVTLNDGSKVTGRFSGKSFASSDIENQDLYLERIHNPKDAAWCKDQNNMGILILKDQIRTIEFTK